jgi:PQQ-dependent catabolism-associated CXXCW motif protein
MQPNVGSPTPTTIPGGHVITTAEMQQAGRFGILMVDVLEGPPHQGIPGAILVPGAGRAGSFSDATQQRLWAVLSQATQMRPDRPVAFFCAGSRCWESYNAALRAEQMGFKMVLWYRGGLGAWQVAGLPMSDPGGGGGGSPQQGAIGFGSPQGAAQGGPAPQ